MRGVVPADIHSCHRGCPSHASPRPSLRCTWEEDRRRWPHPSRPSHPRPPLAVVFWVVGTHELLAGLVLCAALWPSDLGPALTWLATGVISGCLSWALALGLTYLKGIYLGYVQDTGKNRSQEHY
jgi:hypothetical protein